MLNRRCFRLMASAHIYPAAAGTFAAFLRGTDSDQLHVHTDMEGSWCSSVNTSRSNSSSSAVNVIPEAPRGQIPARLVLIGDRRVGTSALIRRFNLGLFDYRPEPAKVMRHTKNVYHQGYNCYVAVQFWDVEGGEMEAGLQCAWRAHAVAVVYDVTNRSSFEFAQEYLDAINPRVSALLIGNKCDLKKYRKVSYREGELLAKIHRIDFIETSALAQYNVDEAITQLISHVPDEYLLGNAKRAALEEKRRRSTSVDSDRCSNCSSQSRDSKEGEISSSPGSSIYASSDTVVRKISKSRSRKRSESEETAGRKASKPIPRGRKDSDYEEVKEKKGARRHRSCEPRMFEKRTVDSSSRRSKKFHST